MPKKHSRERSNSRSNVPSLSYVIRDVSKLYTDDELKEHSTEMGICFPRLWRMIQVITNRSDSYSHKIARGFFLYDRIYECEPSNTTQITAPNPKYCNKCCRRNGLPWEECTEKKCICPFQIKAIIEHQRLIFMNVLPQLHDIIIAQNEQVTSNLFDWKCVTIPSQCADDTVLYVSAPNTEILNRRAQNMLDEFSNWCGIWRVQLNLSKTQTIPFKHPNNSQNPSLKPDELNLTLLGERLELQDKVRYLGVTFTRTLNWQTDLDQALIRVRQRASILRSLGGHFERCHPETLLHTYIKHSLGLI
ncbi:hypothetical protein JTB14_028059 [Gonioctena quinquepunctata]|nr:hypothetical protein JTB14_028059 [Gonioctena quinquepunctata]